MENIAVPNDLCLYFVLRCLLYRMNLNSLVKHTDLNVDPKILLHPTDLNMDKLREAFNAKADIPATKKQLSGKLYKAKIYRNSNFSSWRREILDAIKEKKEKNEPIEEFEKPVLIHHSDGKAWTAYENRVASELKEKFSHLRNIEVISKIFDALKGARTTVAIKVSCLFKFRYSTHSISGATIALFSIFAIKNNRGRSGISGKRWGLVTADKQ